MSSRDPEYEITTPLPEGDAIEGFEVAEELAEWAEIDREPESWRDFKRLVRPLRDHRPVTWHHSQRVATYALGVAVMEKWEDRRLVVYGGLAHDLGKLAVPKEVAENIEGFAEDEKEAKLAAVRPHARDGFEAIAEAGFPFTAAVAGRHHLYQAKPYGVSLSEMPDVLMRDEEARKYLEKSIRLIALADHFDAMTTRANNLTDAERRAALIKDFPLSGDINRIDWLEVNQLA